MRTRSSLFLALVLGTLAAAPAPHKAAVPFIADDYGKALQEARARKVPIFIEAWAPW